MPSQKILSNNRPPKTCTPNILLLNKWCCKLFFMSEGTRQSPHTRLHCIRFILQGANLCLDIGSVVYFICLAPLANTTFILVAPPPPQSSCRTVALMMFFMAAPFKNNHNDHKGYGYTATPAVEKLNLICILSAIGTIIRPKKKTSSICILKESPSVASWKCYLLFVLEFFSKVFFYTRSQSQIKEIQKPIYYWTPSRTKLFAFLVDLEIFHSLNVVITKIWTSSNFLLEYIRVECVLFTVK